MPGATLEPFADHGEVRGDTVTGQAPAADEVLDTVERLGISYIKVTEQLEKEGVPKFEASWSELLASVADGLARFAGSDSHEEARQGSQTLYVIRARAGFRAAPAHPAWPSRAVPLSHRAARC